MPSADPVQLISGLRGVIGVGAWATPNLASRVFGLDPVSNPQAAFLARLFGARDLALAIGTLSTRGEARLLWLRLGAGCDLLDAAAAALAQRNGTVPRPAAVLSGVTALSAAALGAAALARGERAPAL